MSQAEHHAKITQEDRDLAHRILLIKDKHDACGLGIVRGYEGQVVHTSACDGIAQLLADHDAEVERKAREDEHMKTSHVGVGYCQRCAELERAGE